MNVQTLLPSPAHSPHFAESFANNCNETTLKCFADIDLDALIASESIQEQLTTACSCSQFVCTELSRKPERLAALFNDFDVRKNFDKTHYQTLIYRALNAENEADFNRELRLLRALFMLRIIWRDVNRSANLDDTTNELSYLAEVMLQAAIDFHTQQFKARFGTPRNTSGEEQSFVVLGMGKLGARELNLSSDIDLIFCYPDKGETDGEQCGGKSIENQDYFSRLGKKVIQSLDASTAEGRVFRVDMRLRPYGQSGALVSHFAALEEYYQTQGREWERYAMVKARVIAHSGETTRHQELMTMLRNFTYRKYIDFSVIDALRKLKQMIKQEVRRRSLDDDVKLGSGGIREIEFIAQVFQLIRGGRDTELQDNRLFTILPRLETLQCLPSSSVEKLMQAYVFLRNSEHAIQGFNDQQTQKLPTSSDAQQAMVCAMQCKSWQDYLNTLQYHRDHVAAEFEAVIGADDEDDDSVCKDALSMWEAAVSSSSVDNSDDPALPQSLLEFGQSALVQNLTSNSRERLDQFMPILLSYCRCAQGEDDCSPIEAGQSTQHKTDEEAVLLFDTATLDRVIPLLKAIVRRSAYLMLLIENRTALEQLLTLVQTSQQVADQLTKHPALLDELLDTASLYHLPEKTDLCNELQRVMLRVDEDDLEQQMETLRYFKLSHALRVAACEVSGSLPLMQVSDYLTMLAEVILDYCLRYCFQALVARHGYPDGIEREVPEFIIVGYGKLGGIEMNHGSDLDLVFIHNAKISGVTNGERELENQAFYARLGQKLIHILNTQTASGRLYEVDMRLRPSGNSGLLATTIAAFEKYQRNEAWTWEHQALVRARPIAGDSGLAEQFNQIRLALICQNRDLPQLRKDIIEMRLKMRDHLGTQAKETDVFHIKQDAGGIVDIEFMVQYLVLAWSHAEPALATYTDNIRILEALSHTDKLSTQEVEQLIAAYKALRVVTHRLTIEQKSSKISNDELIAERESAIKIWHRLLVDA